MKGAENSETLPAPSESGDRQKLELPRAAVQPLRAVIDGTEQAFPTLEALAKSVTSKPEQRVSFGRNVLAFPVYGGKYEEEAVAVLDTRPLKFAILEDVDNVDLLVLVPLARPVSPERHTEVWWDVRKQIFPEDREVAPKPDFRIHQYEPTVFDTEGRVALEDLTGSSGDSEPFAFNPLRLEDFMALETPPVEFLVKPFVTTGTFNVLQAEPGAAKTWVLLWMALEALKAGNRVLYLTREGTRRGLQARVRQIWGASLPDGFFFQHGGDFQLDDPKWVTSIIEWAKRETIDLVLLDPLSDLHTQDEKEQSGMQHVRDAIKGISEKTGAAVVLAVHTVKEAWKDGAKAPSLSAARGSGVLAGSADLSLHLVPKKNAPGVIVVEGHVVKTKELHDLERKWRFTVLTSGHPTQQSSSFLWEVVKDEDEAEKKDESAQSIVLAYLRKNPGRTQTDVEENAGLRVGRAREAVKALLSEDQLKREGRAALFVVESTPEEKPERDQQKAASMVKDEVLQALKRDAWERNMTGVKS